MKEVRILVLAGMRGSGVEVAEKWLTEQGWAKAEGRNVLDEVARLQEAGQRHVVTAGRDLEELAALKHAYPGEVLTLGVVAAKRQRWNWLKEAEIVTDNEAAKQLDRADMVGRGAVLAAADEYLLNNRGEKELLEELKLILERLEK